MSTKPAAAQVEPSKLLPEASQMRRTRPPYSPEFRRQMVELVHAGRDPADLAREFEPSAESIRAWVTLAARREGGREEKAKVEDLSATERDELGRLRRENKQLRVERDILSGVAARFVQNCTLAHVWAIFDCIRSEHALSRPTRMR